MTTLKQLRQVKPNDYIEITWPEQNNAYCKIYHLNKRTITVSNLFFNGYKPESKLTFSIKQFCEKYSCFKIIPSNSKKARTIEGKLDD